MDDLFATQAQRLDAEQEARDRIACQAKIEEYNARIKDCIVKLYEAKGKQIARLIAITKEIPLCKDAASLQRLKDEVQAISAECEEFCKTLCPRTSLCLYDKWYREHTFPQWHIEVTQEWCDYWQTGMVLGGSTRFENWGSKGSGIKPPPEKVLGLSTEYKSRDIHVNIWDTITRCELWRGRYSLQHLDALVLHVSK
jgi:hypothetical protein